MSILINKADFTGHIFHHLTSHAALAGGQIDGMKMIQLLAGIITETLLLFDEPDEGLEATYDKLALLLECEPYPGPIAVKALPPSYVIDYETEQGRGIAKCLFEDWLDCAYAFHELIVFVIHNLILRMEESGQLRSETFRLFIECTNRCMAYEIAAQELCDIVIDKKIGQDSWSLAESVSGLSAFAGRCLALSQNACELFSMPMLPDKLDQVAYVMTQEAIRLGIPAGTDWRFGLAANDHGVAAPYELINSLDPVCHEFFGVIQLHGLMDQAVACAKAAGRMLAVAAGGEAPEIEPVIAKPLAMAAMTDTYKTVCTQEAILSC
ncbi:MAG: hypothetical protein CO093_10835 [Alphaproteobacteria bacterium CG_4_9_14_3_um_filter_47_13]|nr:MAG: hypothetical protein CO093_10835 [Alphaproteobacteria bacterium CG_4_9_14_3_um_filter_47_13]